MEIDLIKEVPDGVSFVQNAIELKGKWIDEEFDLDETTETSKTKWRISKKIFD